MKKTIVMLAVCCLLAALGSTAWGQPVASPDTGIDVAARGLRITELEVGPLGPDCHHAWQARIVNRTDMKIESDELTLSYWRMEPDGAWSMYHTSPAGRFAARQERRVRAALPYACHNKAFRLVLSHGDRIIDERTVAVAAGVVSNSISIAKARLTDDTLALILRNNRSQPACGLRVEYFKGRIGKPDFSPAGSLMTDLLPNETRRLEYSWSPQDDRLLVKLSRQERLFEEKVYDLRDKYRKLKELPDKMQLHPFDRPTYVRPSG